MAYFLCAEENRLFDYKTVVHIDTPGLNYSRYYVIRIVNCEQRKHDASRSFESLCVLLPVNSNAVDVSIIIIHFFI